MKSGKDILIISRDQVAVNLVHRLARDEGYSCMSVFNESELAVHVIKRDLKLAIIDSDMEEIEWSKAINIIKGKCPALPVIVLSSGESLETGRKILKKNIFYHLLKPISKSEMFQAIKSAVDGRDEIQSKFRTEVRALDWYRENIPCMDACPVHTDSGKYVQLIAEGKFEEAYLVARSPNPLASTCGKVCAAFCEDACRRSHLDSPVTIRALKRFVTSRYGPESERPETFRILFQERDQGDQRPWNFPALHKSQIGDGRKIAVVGAGPAGLACAHDLTAMGFSVTLYEASDVCGGAMKLCIPEYRLPRRTLDGDIEAILSLGIEVRLDTPLSDKFGIRELRKKGFEAIFLATGALKGAGLDIPGADLDGVFKAVDYLLNFKKGYRVDLGEKVIIIGGGKVALDTARTAWRQITETPFLERPDWEAMDTAKVILRTGKKPLIIYPESMQEMTAAQTIQGQEEVEALREEGIEMIDQMMPKKIIDKDGKVAGIVFDRVSSITDTEGRFAPQIIPNSEEIFEADSVVFAIGQLPDVSYLREEDGIKVSPSGFIQVDALTMATGAPGIYAGGDIAFGPRTIIEAVYTGKVAAQSIAEYITGEKAVRKMWATVEEIPARAYRMAAGYEKMEKETPPAIPVERRVGIAEVEMDFTVEQARKQAQRCLRCQVETIYDSSKCILCGRCVDICPENSLKLVPLEDVDLKGETMETLIKRLGYHEENETLSAMIKDDDKCIRCGLCALRCPTGAITMEQFSFMEN